MTFALGVERSAAGQPWKWRRSGEPDLTMDALVDELLLARGVVREDLERHRKPTIRDFLPDPSSFKDMDKGAKRLADAVRAGETIAIFGDYDVDGATSAALLALLLRRLGVEPMVYIPDRLMEGYGPSGAALVELKRRGASLAVTVDCGAQAFDALQEAKDAGLDVIVVDHHQCATLLPVAFALINPNRLDEAELGAAHGHLAAVGMAFLLGVALVRELRGRGAFEGKEEPKLIDLLDLVALGTVADVVPLKGLNRAFVAKGLIAMRRRDNPGLTALMDASRLSGPPEPWHLGFMLGPRINAGGRIGRADLGARLLMEDNSVETGRIAAELDRLNRERQAIEIIMVAEAEAEALAALGLEEKGAVVVTASEGWHSGVVGLVAARLKERFGRPAFAIALDQNGVGTGSGRSIPGVDLGKAVRRAVHEGLLLKGGGHAMAAGVTLAKDALASFRAYLESTLSGAVEAARRDDALLIDGAVSAAGVNAELIATMERAGPFGAGNPEPIIALPAHTLVYADEVGQGHIRARLRSADGAVVNAIAFRAVGQKLGQALLQNRGHHLHAAGTVCLDRWNGLERVQLRICDVAPVSGVTP